MTEITNMKPESPVTWIAGGTALAVAAVGLWDFAANVSNSWLLYAASIIVGILGWVLTTAGTVTLGVRAGARWVDYERQRAN